MDFKQKAIEAFINNVRTQLPHLSEHELKTMELCFQSGFNVGIAKDKGELEQELALSLLRI